MHEAVDDYLFFHFQVEVEGWDFLPYRLLCDLMDI
jgi:hypothetical protein